MLVKPSAAFSYILKGIQLSPPVAPIPPPIPGFGVPAGSPGAPTPPEVSPGTEFPVSESECSESGCSESAAEFC